MLRSLTSKQLVVDIVIAGLFVALVAPFELALRVPVDSALLGRLPADGAFEISMILGSVVLFGGALAVRRLAPGIALAVAWLAAVIQMLALRPPSLVDVAVFAVLYAAAAYGSRPVLWLGVASACAGAVVITVYLSVAGLVIGIESGNVSVSLAILVAALFALLLSWTAGALVRTVHRARQIRAAQERAEAEAIAEAERVRIARDMHDVVAHSLAVVVAQADGARYALEADPAVAASALATISGTARAALADVRLLLAQLRYRESDGPQPTLADLGSLFSQFRAAGLDLRVHEDPPPSTPPAAVQLAVFRILQEGLTNALRHGDPGPVDVELAWTWDQVDVAIRNPAGATARAGAGHGTIGMRERAQLVGGEFSATVGDGAYTARARIPVGGGR